MVEYRYDVPFKFTRKIDKLTWNYGSFAGVPGFVGNPPLNTKVSLPPVPRRNLGDGRGEPVTNSKIAELEAAIAQRDNIMHLRPAQHLPTPCAVQVSKAAASDQGSTAS
jgi:hypothetical protein